MHLGLVPTRVMKMCNVLLEDLNFSFANNALDLLKLLILRQIYRIP